MKKLLFALGLLLSSSSLMAAELITLESRFGFEETFARLERMVQEDGLTVFGVIDHAVAAQEMGGNLPNTRLLLFGSPKLGTRLMEASRSIGLDLPLKVLVWENDTGAVLLQYTDPHELLGRYGLDDKEKIVGKMHAKLGEITERAAGIRKTQWD